MPDPMPIIIRAFFKLKGSANMITRFFQTEKKTFSSRPRILGSAVISVGPQVHGLLRSRNDASSSSTSNYNVGVCVCVCCYVRLVQ